MFSATITYIIKSARRRWRRLKSLRRVDPIIHGEEVISLPPINTATGPKEFGERGLSHLEKYRRLGTLDHLTEAIECFSRALAMTPDDNPDWQNWLTKLGMTYGERFRRLCTLEDLEKSIEHSSRALASIPDGPDISDRLAILAGSYGDRFRLLGDLEDLDKSIEYNSRALAYTPYGDPAISYRLDNLAASYNNRFQRLGNLDDLKKSIGYNSSALSLTDGNPSLSYRLNNLGGSYMNRFQHLRDLEDLEKSIEYFSRATALTPDWHPDVSSRLTALGGSYDARFQRLGELEDLEKSIEHLSRALASTPDGHPGLPNRLAALGGSYNARFKRLGNPEDLEKSIEYQTRALASTPDGHPDLPARYFNYALSTLSQYDSTSDISHLHTSLHSLRTASHLLSGAPNDKFEYALKWASLASQYPHLNILEAYQAVIDLLPQFLWLGVTANQRRQKLSTTSNLAVSAACAAISSSDYSLALEWLEYARCIAWNQSLMLRSPLDQLQSSHPDLATRLETIANQLHNSTFEVQVVARWSDATTCTPEQAGQQRLRLANEYHSLLTQVRQLPEFEDFLQPVRVNKLIRAARNGPIVVINCHTDRCDALFILPGHDNVEHLHLPNFTDQKAQQARSDLETSLRYMNRGERGVRRQLEESISMDEDRLESVLSVLWNDIVKPVLDYLGYSNDVPSESLPHITWCPTSTLSFLPLHAAGDYTQSRSRVFDYVISSYTPTVTALLDNNPSIPDPDCRHLTVGQANTPGHSPLPGTTQEAAHIKARAHHLAQYSQLLDAQATTTSVLDAMEHHHWVHLACHAHQNVND
ncbi:unnamed protein product, partial [Rhizoctonia solani]